MVYKVELHSKGSAMYRLSLSSWSTALNSCPRNKPIMTAFVQAEIDPSLGGVLESDVWNYMDKKLEGPMHQLREKWTQRPAGSLDIQFKWLQGLPSNIADPLKMPAAQLEYMVSRGQAAGLGLLLLGLF